MVATAMRPEGPDGSGGSGGEARLREEIEKLRRELRLCISTFAGVRIDLSRVKRERDRLRARLDRVLDALDPVVDLDQPETGAIDAPMFGGGGTWGAGAGAGVPR